MQIDSFEVVFYTFSFLVPGYIMECIITSLLPASRKSEGIKFLHCIVYSIINHTIWFSWGYKLISDRISSGSIWYWVVIVASVLVTSAITGFVIGMLRASMCIYRLGRKILGHFGINLTHPVPTAWDYVFSSMKTGAWVTIRMDNGKFIRGWFGPRSMASSDNEFRDIFVETQYTLDADENWVEVKNSGGVWVNASSICHIELLSPTQENINDKTEIRKENKKDNQNEKKKRRKKK